MRIGIEIIFDKQIKIPITYRKNIQSFFKEALLQTDSGKEILNTFFVKEKNSQKPYTFSLKFNKPIKKDKYLLVNSKKFTIFFSTNDYNFLISIYNGIKKLQSYPLFGCKNHNLKVFPIRSEIINKNRTIFKTFSPILVRDIHDRKGKGFLKFDDDKFKSNFLHNIQNLGKNFLNKIYTSDEIRLSFFESKSVIAPTYGGEVGNNLIFQMEAPVELLQLVYDIGIGAKRSQGYGMLKVLE